jgi:hypothetical protein
MLEIFLPTIRWNASIRGLLEHLHWMSREYDVLVSVSDDSENSEKHAFLTQLGKGSSRFRVLLQSPRLGMFRNFAELFSRAARPYGLLVSDDDWVAAEYLLGADKLLDAQPNVAAVMGLFLHVMPEEGAALHAPVNVAARAPAERIEQYLRQDDSFNHSLYSVFRCAAVLPFCRYVNRHPLPASFFDYLIVFSMLARGALVSRNCGPYVYSNTNWTSPDRVWESNNRSYAQFGLPEWFTDFHQLYRGIEGFNFLAGPLSPIQEPAERRRAGLAVLSHYLKLFKRQVLTASPQWWERARQLHIANPLEAFKASSEMLPASVLEIFLLVLRAASPAIGERYVEFHDTLGET